MLGWWARYIGIQPYFQSPIRLTIKGARIVAIQGGREADALRRFLKFMETKVGEAVYYFDAFHFGVHPNAVVQDHQCPNVMYKRLIEHSHSCNIHVHVGSPGSNEKYPYWMHVTGDIRQATLKIGDTVVYENGYLKALEHPKVIEIEKKYPGRPGIPDRF